MSAIAEARLRLKKSGSTFSRSPVNNNKLTPPPKVSSSPKPTSLPSQEPPVVVDSPKASKAKPTLGSFLSSRPPSFHRHGSFRSNGSDKINCHTSNNTNNQESAVRPAIPRNASHRSASSWMSNKCNNNNPTPTAGVEDASATTLSTVGSSNRQSSFRNSDNKGLRSLVYVSDDNNNSSNMNVEDHSSKKTGNQSVDLATKGREDGEQRPHFPGRNSRRTTSSSWPPPAEENGNTDNKHDPNSSPFHLVEQKPPPCRSNQSTRSPGPRLSLNPSLSNVSKNSDNSNITNMNVSAAAIESTTSTGTPTDTGDHEPSPPSSRPPLSSTLDQKRSSFQRNLNSRSTGAWPPPKPSSSNSGAKDANNDDDCRQVNTQTPKSGDDENNCGPSRPFLSSTLEQKRPSFRSNLSSRSTGTWPPKASTSNVGAKDENNNDKQAKTQTPNNGDNDCNPAPSRPSLSSTRELKASSSQRNLSSRSTGTWPPPKLSSSNVGAKDENNNDDHEDQQSKAQTPDSGDDNNGGQTRPCLSSTLEQKRPSFRNNLSSRSTGTWPPKPSTSNAGAKGDGDNNDDNQPKTQTPNSEDDDNNSESSRPSLSATLEQKRPSFRRKLSSRSTGTWPPKPSSTNVCARGENNNDNEDQQAKTQTPNSGPNRPSFSSTSEQKLASFRRNLSSRSSGTWPPPKPIASNSKTVTNTDDENKGCASGKNEDGTTALQGIVQPRSSDRRQQQRPCFRRNVSQRSAGVPWPTSKSSKGRESIQDEFMQNEQTVSASSLSSSKRTSFPRQLGGKGGPSWSPPKPDNGLAPLQSSRVAPTTANEDTIVNNDEERKETQGQDEEDERSSLASTSRESLRRNMNYGNCRSKNDAWPPPNQAEASELANNSRDQKKETNTDAKLSPPQLPAFRQNAAFRVNGTWPPVGTMKTKPEQEGNLQDGEPQAPPPSLVTGVATKLAGEGDNRSNDSVPFRKRAQTQFSGPKNPSSSTGDASGADNTGEPGITVVRRKWGKPVANPGKLSLAKNTFWASSSNSNNQTLPPPASAQNLKGSLKHAQQAGRKEAFNATTSSTVSKNGSSNNNNSSLSLLNSATSRKGGGGSGSVASVNSYANSYRSRESSEHGDKGVTQDEDKNVAEKGDRQGKVDDFSGSTVGAATSVSSRWKPSNFSNSGAAAPSSLTSSPLQKSLGSQSVSPASFNKYAGGDKALPKPTNPKDIEVVEKDGDDGQKKEGKVTDSLRECGGKGSMSTGGNSNPHLPAWKVRLAANKADNTNLGQVSSSPFKKHVESTEPKRGFRFRAKFDSKISTLPFQKSTEAKPDADSLIKDFEPPRSIEATMGGQHPVSTESAPTDATTMEQQPASTKSQSEPMITKEKTPGGLASPFNMIEDSLAKTPKKRFPSSTPPWSKNSGSTATSIQAPNSARPGATKEPISETYDAHSKSVAALETRELASKTTIPKKFGSTFNTIKGPNYKRNVESMSASILKKNGGAEAASSITASKQSTDDANSSPSSIKAKEESSTFEKNGGSPFRKSSLSSPFSKSNLKPRGTTSAKRSPTRSPPRVHRIGDVSTTTSRFEVVPADGHRNPVAPQLDQLRKLHVVADTETTPRDNEVVQALVDVMCSRPEVGQLHVTADPRWQHLSPSTLPLDMADALCYNVFLTHLTLTHLAASATMGNAFLTSLAQALPNNHTLQVLDLQSNPFTSDALAEFCITGLRGNPSALHTVYLHDQQSKIFSHSEEAVLGALQENSTVTTLTLEFLSGEKCETKLKDLLERNRKNPSKGNRDTALAEYFSSQVEQAQKDHELEQAMEKQLEQHSVSQQLDEKKDSMEYFYELEIIAQNHKVDLNCTNISSESTKPTDNSTFAFLGGGGANTKLNLVFPSSRMTADGAFLDAAFIDTYLQEDKGSKKTSRKILTFEFTNQCKLFQRFTTDDSARHLIVKKFVQALVGHPRQDEINILNMANSCIGDDFVEHFCKECLQKRKFANLHQINWETNFLSDQGLVALAENLQRHDGDTKRNHWIFLQCVHLDNQKSPIKTAAEMALARSMMVNRTVIRFGLRVRNLRERERIQKCVQRNVDYLRQARQYHRQATGTLKPRSRNRMEQYFDKIASNDASVTDIDLVGDGLFLALSGSEVLKTGAALANNTHVTTLKLSLLKLDDAWAQEFAVSLANNKTLRCVRLDNNAIGGAGICAIVEALSQNTSVTELHVRHQSKPVSSVDEEKLAGFLAPNTTLVKFGIDVRSTRAQADIQRKLRQNQERRRKEMRSKTPPPTRRGETRSPPPPNTKSKIKSNATQQLLDRVKANDRGLTEIALNQNPEFIELNASQKKAFLQTLGQNSHVTRLVLDHCDLDNGFAEDLAMCLKVNQSLRTVSLNGNLFTSPGLLAIGLAGRERLTELSLLKPRFSITDADSALLFEACQKQCSWTKLNLEFRDDTYDQRIKALLKV